MLLQLMPRLEHYVRLIFYDDDDEDDDLRYLMVVCS